MPWFRLEDSFHGNPKVTAAGNAAVGLWVRCGTYSAQWLMDGRVPATFVRQMGSAREIERLVVTKLWVPTDDGFVMPDFLDYNPSSDQVRAERKAAAERKRRQRARGANGVEHDTSGRFTSHGMSRLDIDDVTP